MPINDHDYKRQYTQYRRHINESQERVNANTVNTLQNDLQNNRVDTNLLKDTQFEERVYTIFENNLFTNAMSIDMFKNGEYVNLTDSVNIKVNPSKDQLALETPYSNGKLISMKRYSTFGSDAEMNDFILVTNEYIPTGGSIKYYLETSSGERWPIKQNKIKLPLHLSENIVNGFIVVAEIEPNAMHESPVLNGYAVLYWDSKVEEHNGLVNPDLLRFP